MHDLWTCTITNLWPSLYELEFRNKNSYSLSANQLHPVGTHWLNTSIAEEFRHTVNSAFSRTSYTVRTHDETRMATAKWLTHIPINSVARSRWVRVRGCRGKPSQRGKSYWYMSDKIMSPFPGSGSLLLPVPKNADQIIIHTILFSISTCFPRCLFRTVYFSV